MEEQKSSSNKKIIIGILIALLVGLGVYTWTSNNKHKASEEFLKQEKEQILGNLTAMEQKYDEAIAKNNSLTDELTMERDKIIAFRDSVKNLKEINASVIRKYRNRIASLEKTNERLLFMNDSLTIVNNLLVVEKDSITGELVQAVTANDTLMAQNMDLSEKVKIGGALKVNTIKAVAMRLRGNGKYTETNKAQKAEAIRLTFRIERNEITEPGEKSIHIIIQNPSGKVVSEKGTFTTREGKELSYTDSTTVNYKNAEEDVVLFVDKIQKKFVKGNYTVKVYVEGNLVGATKLQLKDAFLGL
ncbi:MAG: hypothetical protein CSA39_06970 [Flavobacteriales bacterium]|nr:MAG: hypothetical protein CR985_03705 [Flavobacteriales bacterium]PIE48590.1 MAG: hypothetical protein CSA39_06970 [Flavobacteriales bacterium]